MSKEEDKQEIPDVIYDAITKTSYKKGRFLGKVSINFLFIILCSERCCNIYFNIQICLIGRFCKMLRNNRFAQKVFLCRKNGIENVNGKREST